MTALEGIIGALMIEIGDPDPFPMPGVGAIARVDPARGEEAFGNHRAAFLRCPQQPQEFGRELIAVRPMNIAFRTKVNCHITGAA
ncbi:hypothetical protein [Bradyrhizobium sp. AZCC 1719]|uniref:hypothetical protein n=1 Tax=Bradyrhizobium sp. AZCC 1719 TaxID=3117028 RepID=UPI002FEE909C